MKIQTVSGGTARTDKANEEAKRVETVAQIVTAAETSGAAFGPKPVVRDQLLKLPTTCRLAAKEFRMFTLSKDADQLELNRFLAMTEPAGSPELQLIGQKEYFSSHKAVVIVTVWFRRVEYLQMDAPQVEKLSKLLEGLESAG